MAGKKIKNRVYLKISALLLMVVGIIIFFFVYQDKKTKSRLPCIKNNNCTKDASICNPGGYCNMVDTTDTSFRPIRIGLCVCGVTPTPLQNPPDLSKQKAE
jgi:hypothetical protein